MKEELVGQWLKEMTLEELPEDCRELAQVIGVEAAAQMVIYYGGTGLYIRKAETLIRRKRDEHVARDYEAGIDVDDLVRKYGLCKSRIYQIVEEQQAERQSGQMPLFAVGQTS